MTGCIFILFNYSIWITNMAKTEMNAGLADKVMLFVYMILEVTCFKQLAGLILYPNLKLSEQRFVVVLTLSTKKKKKKSVL